MGEIRKQTYLELSNWGAKDSFENALSHLRKGVIVVKHADSKAQVLTYQTVKEDVAQRVNYLQLFIVQVMTDNFLLEEVICIQVSNR